MCSTRSSRSVVVALVANGQNILNYNVYNIN